MLASFEEIIGKYLGLKMSEFKTFYRERYLEYINRMVQDHGYLHIASDLMYAYFCLSPKDFIDIVNKTPNAPLTERQKIAILKLAHSAEQDGFTTWAEIIIESITNIK
jgi:hypothetical protein